MTESTPETLQELHRIREQLAKEQEGLSAKERVRRTRQTADQLLAVWGLTLHEVPPSSLSSARPR